MYHFDDRILLVICHLDVTRQAQTSVIDVSSDIGTGSCDISVSPAATVSVYSDEFVHAVDRLHVHRFPDGSAFVAVVVERIEDLMRGALARLGIVQVVVVTTNLTAHGFFIDDHTTEPIVRLGILLIVWVHLYRQVR